MADIKQDITDNLETITDYCGDSAKGYRNAAESIQEGHPTVARVWLRHADVREQYSAELNERLKCIGESERNSSSIKGDLHRGYLKLKGILASDKFEAERLECIRGEEEFLGLVTDTLSEGTLDGETKRLLTRISLDISNSLKSLGYLSQ
jgi:uncharacterized protein (TIGR02284 family)